MPNEEAARLAEDWNEDLEKMEVGVSSRDHFLWFLIPNRRKEFSYMK